MDNKKLFFYFLIAAGLIEGTLAGYGLSLKKATEIKTRPPEKSVTEEARLPKKVVIPKLGIETEVKPVGLDSEGQMEMPPDYWAAAWYQTDISLGKKGSTVIAGHLDSPKGPAVFYRLSQLEKGDVVLVFDQNGREYQFSVVKKETYEEDQFPLAEVFAAADKARLNLITCRGKFNRSTRRYDKRIVVYTELLN